MFDVIINISIVLLILGILIFIHELGHFLAARAVNAKVEAFAIGMGPKILSWIRGETEYRINLLPIGGYVKILGEGDEKLGKKEKKDPRSLKNKTILQRMFVMLAGVTMNFILAFVIYQFLIVQSGYKWNLPGEFSDFEPKFGRVVLNKTGELKYDGLIDELGAQKAEIPETGILKSINEQLPTYSFDVSEILLLNRSKVVDLEVCNESCNSYPVEVNEEGRIGILLDQNYELYISYEDNKLLAGVGHAVNILDISVSKLSDVFSSAKASGDYGEVANSVAGPVGIYIIIEYFKSYGFLTLLNFLADFSLTLAVINLLPIPALDGGRVLLLSIEAIIRKPLNEKLEAFVINFSFLILLFLMFGIILKDIIFFEQLRSLFK